MNTLTYSPDQLNRARALGLGLGLLPPQGGLSGAGGDLDYFRVYASSARPGVLFVQASRAVADGDAGDAALQLDWYTVGPDLKPQPFNPFTDLRSSLDRMAWHTSLVDVTPAAHV